MKNALIKSTDHEIIHIMNQYSKSRLKSFRLNIVAISIFVSDKVIRKYNMNACFNLLVLQLLKKPFNELKVFIIYITYFLHSTRTQDSWVANSQRKSRSKQQR